MKKVAIRFSIDKEDDVKSIAQNIQCFIVEGDYEITSIIKQIRDNERIVLDVSMEENMPDFTDLVVEFDEDELEYELYKPLNEDWDKCNLEDLKLDRTPSWINFLIGLNILWYFLMTFIQFFAIYDWYSQKYEFSVLTSGVGAFISTLVPFFGSFLAYWSAVELWQWESYMALWAFFGYYLPLLGFILYLIAIIIKVFYGDRWYRFRHPEFN